jgi:LmbE family N-acetylglucosaminyl deacetylase
VIRSVFISPHDDDQVLFGAFTLLRETPIVVIVYDSYVQPSRGLAGTEWHLRAAESERACEILGCTDVRRLRFSDASPDVTPAYIRNRLEDALSDVPPSSRRLYFPAYEANGHEQHNIVHRGCLPAALLSPTSCCYMTYTRTMGKSVSEREVPITSANWITRKLKALACFESQFSLNPNMGCWPHFLRDQREYYL